LRPMPLLSSFLLLPLPHYRNEGLDPVATHHGILPEASDPIVEYIVL
jgi:hypothetical protein